MSTPQAGILAPVPAHGRYLTLQRRADATAPAWRRALQALAAQADGEQLVVGLGASLVEALTGRAADAVIPGLHDLAPPEGSRMPLPSTPVDLWLWLRGTGPDDGPGALLLRSRELIALLAEGYDVSDELAAFRHADGRDLTGYEDGTENPQGDDAPAVAFVHGRGDGLDGSSLVAVQQWEHAMAAFEAMTPTEQDDSVGRRRSDNEELDDAPESAHVKRTAQENFDPEAFVLRRSMPWAEGARCGLHFVAFAASLAAFEAQLRRMSGAEDDIVDALFRFSRPITATSAWCPPLRDGRLDLRALGLVG
ncbi:MAG: Dyp-type peroxidase [Leptothrix sp. (in: b-proteobacteria)]